LFIAVVTRAVEKAVACLHSFEDHLLTLVVGNLPQAEANCWHAIARGESKGRLSVLKFPLPVSNSGKDTARTLKWLARVVCDAVIDDHKHAGLPLVHESILCHECL
ncbi:MAG: hypothetical protein ACK56I_21975, partial [bacterium]